MRKIGCFLLLLACCGCVTVKIPKYLADNNPYREKFYASYELVLTMAQQALVDAGWKISEIANPAIFEKNDVSGAAQGKQILIFTEMRQTPMIFFSRYMSLNVLVHSTDDSSTDVEIRYASVTPVLFWNAKGYKNDAVVHKIFSRIAELLEK